MINKFRLFFVLAFRNARRNFRHSIATVLAVSSGFMALTLFDGFVRDLTSQTIDGFSVRGMFGHLIIEKEGAAQHIDEDLWKYSLTKQDQDFIESYLKSNNNVEERVRFLTLSGLISNSATQTLFMGFGYDVDDGRRVRTKRWEWDAVAGKPLFLAQEPSVLVAEGLGKLMSCENQFKGEMWSKEGSFIAEDRPFACEFPRLLLSVTTEQAQVNALEIPVWGMIDAGFREANQRFLHLPLSVAQSLLDTDKLTLISVKLKNPQNLSQFTADFAQQAKQQGLSLVAVPWLQHRLAAMSRGGLEIIGVLKNLFLLIVIAVSMMSVANTMMKNVTERVREIGMFRSLGYLARDMQIVLVFEASILVLMACALGALGSLGVSCVLDYLKPKYSAGIASLPIIMRVSIDIPSWIFTALLLSLFAGTVSAILARRVCRMGIAEALRSV